MTSLGPHYHWPLSTIKKWAWGGWQCPGKSNASVLFHPCCLGLPSLAYVRGLGSDWAPAPKNECLIFTPQTAAAIHPPWSRWGWGQVRYHPVSRARSSEDLKFLVPMSRVLCIYSYRINLVNNHVRYCWHPFSRRDRGVTCSKSPGKKKTTGFKSMTLHKFCHSQILPYPDALKRWPPDVCLTLKSEILQCLKLFSIDRKQKWEILYHQVWSYAQNHLKCCTKLPQTCVWIRFTWNIYEYV